MAEGWLDSQLAGAPEALVERTREFVTDPVTADTLAVAADQALGRAIGAGCDRRGALDLLAADALVTLALAAQNEVEPDGLARFARSLLGAPPTSV